MRSYLMYPKASCQSPDPTGSTTVATVVYATTANMSELARVGKATALEPEIQSNP